MTKVLFEPSVFRAASTFGHYITNENMTIKPLDISL